MNDSAQNPRAAIFCLALMSCLPVTVMAADTPPPAPAGFPASVLQSLLDIDTTQSTPRPLTIKGWKTKADTKTLFIRTPELPMFDIHVSFAAGSALENDKPGLAGMTFSLLNEGVEGKNDHAAISETFDGLGAKLGQTLDQGRATFSLRSLSDPEKSAPALQLFAQILGQPSLSEEALIRVKNELGGLLQARQQESTALASLRLQELLAPETAYARSIYGTDAGLASITRKAVQDFHRQAYSARQAQITVVGDLTVEQAQTISLQIANALPDTPVNTSPAAPFKPTGMTMTSHIERAQEQVHVLLGQPSVSRRHDDFVALNAASVIFGRGTNSRLITELRHKRGLVYYAGIQTHDWAESGLTTISLDTSPQFADGTVALVRSMFSDYLRDGPTQEELDHLKRRLANMSVSGRASNAQILERLVEINRNHLPLDLDFFIEQVQRLTLKEIKAAMDKHLTDDEWRVVTVGPTVEQLPLVQPADAPADNPSRSLCRADASFVAS